MPFVEQRLLALMVDMLDKLSGPARRCMTIVTLSHAAGLGRNLISRLRNVYLETGQLKKVDEHLRGSEEEEISKIFSAMAGTEPSYEQMMYSFTERTANP